MKLKEGSKAIDFSVEDINGRLISLRDFRGKKLMLSFYRCTECLYSRLRIHQLTERYSEFSRKGLEKLAFFQSSKEQIMKHTSALRPPFPLVSDTRRKIYRTYNVGDSLPGYFKGYFRIFKAAYAISLGFIPGAVEGSKTLMPADFLISEDGKITRAHYGKDISDHIPFSEIEKFLLSPKKFFPHKNIMFFHER